MVGIITDGALCTSPGPSFRVAVGAEGIGKDDEGICSPGKTTVCVAVGGMSMVVTEMLLREDQFENKFIQSAS